MQEESTATLRHRRELLLQELPPFDAVLRGSLIERYKRCGKPGCKCAAGPGHGPKYYLSVSRSNERPAMQYVPVTFRHIGATDFRRNGATQNCQNRGSNGPQECVFFASFTR